MSDRTSFEDRLEAAVERYAQGARTDVDAYAVARLLLASGGSRRWARLTSPFDAPAVRLVAALVVLLLALAAAVVVGRALQREPPLPVVQGEFTVIGPAPQGQRLAVPLSDGRVLLFGAGTEQNTGRDIGFVDVFDPGTRALSRLDNIPIVRRSGPDSIVELADGRVLLTDGERFAGNGTDGFTSSAATELIDLDAGEVTKVGQMAYPRYGHTATRLPDGRVLIAGGTDDRGIIEHAPPGELFDPGTESFREIDPLQHARMNHRATLLDDGRVLLTGGSDGGAVLASEIFDPATETFEVLGSLGQGRVRHSSTLLQDGRVLVVGGGGFDIGIANSALASAELFDPATNAFSPVDDLTTPREEHAAVQLENGPVLIAGGVNGYGQPSTTELFDPATGTFARGADTIDRLGYTTAALLPDGTALVVGEHAGLERFDPARSGRAAPTPGPRGELAGTVTTVEPPAVEREGHTATLLADGRVLVVGGWAYDLDPHNPTDSAEIFDPRSGKWSSTGSLNDARAYHTATLLPDGRVLVVGGHMREALPDGSTETVALDSAEVYEPSTGEFTLTDHMSLARAGSGGCCPQVERFAATALADGRVLIAGGTDKPGLDLFDPGTNTFTGVPTGCQGDTVMLADGRLLLGCGPGYIFDPTSGQVDTVTNRDELQSIGTRLQDGRLLFTDAVGSNPMVLHPEFNGAEAFPWTAMARFNEILWDRYGVGTNVETITPLPDGRILVFASRPDDANHPLHLGFAAVFDPKLVTFTEVVSPAGRYANTATMLQDGRILFVGRPVRSPDRTDPEPPEAELLDLGLPR
jgi:hypothetical protein